MTNQLITCRQCDTKFTPTRKNSVNCSTECSLIQRQKQWNQRLGVGTVVTPVSKSNKIKVQKLKITDDHYDWRMISSLTGGGGYG